MAADSDSPNDHYDRAFQNGESSIAELNRHYGVQPPGESLQGAMLRRNQETFEAENRANGVREGESLPAAIVRQNEERWQDTEARLSKEMGNAVDAGVPANVAYQNLLNQYGFEANTKLSFSPHNAGDAPANGVNQSTFQPSRETGYLNH